MVVPSRTVVTSGSLILTTFYKPVQFKVAESGTSFTKVQMAQIDDRSGVVENRIAGSTPDRLYFRFYVTEKNIF